MKIVRIILAVYGIVFGIMGIYVTFFIHLALLCFTFAIFKGKRIVRAFSIAFCIVSTFAVCTLFYFFWQFRQAATPVTDPARYEMVLERWKEYGEEYVRHFPRPIPKDASNVKFYFRPAFLQADAWMELRYQTSSQKINELYEIYKQPEAVLFSAESFIWFYTFTRGNTYEAHRLSEDFGIFNLHKDPNKTGEHDPRWGVAISKKENEIIYWAEW